MDTSIEILTDATTQELYIEIPQHIREELGWHEGTQIDWQIQEDCIILSKIEDSTIISEESRETYDDQAECEIYEIEGWDY